MKVAALRLPESEKDIKQVASRLQMYLGGENSTDFLGFSHFWDDDGACKSSFICGASAMEGPGPDSVSRS